VRILAALVLFVSLSFNSGRAFAEDTDVEDVPEPTHLKSPTQCRTERGSEVNFPPGYFLPEPTWLRLDNEVRRLQEQETRLTAENNRLRELTRSGPGRTLFWVGTGLLAGFAAGALGAYYF